MIGVHLKRIRKERHLSQEQVAQRLNISRQAISRWENDLAMPDIDNLVVLSRLFEVSIEELLGEKEVISEEETGTLIESPLQEEKKFSEIILACAIIMKHMPNLKERRQKNYVISGMNRHLRKLPPIL